MEETKISKKKEILTILLLTMVIATGTFAWIVWSSNDNTQMNVTIGELADVSFKTGSDINIGNLSPSFYYDDGALTEFSIRKKKGLTTELNTNIYLDITSIDEELKNDNFKYILLSSSDDNNYNEVASGSFKDASIGKLDIIKDSVLADNKTYYKFYIWIDGNNENNETMQGRSMKASLNVKVATPTANFVEELDDETTGDSGSGVYKVHHDAIPADSSATGEEIPAVDDYRYYGPSPNNYICLDMESQSTCPDRSLFRIIGSIYEENASKNLIKVIKATPLTDGTTSTFSLDGSESTWSSETSGTSNGASLMQLLNGIYLTSGTGTYDDVTVDFTNTGLTSKIQELMNKGNGNFSRYYLGQSRPSGSNNKTLVQYLEERGNKKYSGNAVYWDGEVGLMYFSDYGYVSGTSCVTNKYIYEYYNNDCNNKNWVVGSINGHFMHTYDNRYELVLNDGRINQYGDFIKHAAHPVFYLKSDITLIGGTGTETDPYIVQ